MKLLTIRCCSCIEAECDDDVPYNTMDEVSRLVDGGSIPGGRYASVGEYLHHNKSVHDDEANLWTNPDDHTHSIEEDDRALMSLLHQKDSSSPSEKIALGESIDRIRERRKETMQRWRGILIDLGFDNEADKLLEVHTIAESGDPSTTTPGVAEDLHRRLTEESSIFGRSSSQAARYIAVLNRLLDLDVAEDFVTAAIEKFPRIDPKK